MKHVRKVQVNEEVRENEKTKKLKGQTYAKELS